MEFYYYLRDLRMGFRKSKLDDIIEKEIDEIDKDIQTELKCKSLKELKTIWEKEEQLTQIRFDIIIAMLSEDPKLYDMLKEFFEKCELLQKLGFYA
jgi:hypothetical protein